MDPEWLAHRKYGGPSPEDLRALEVPDPLVKLRLAYGSGCGGDGVVLTGASDPARGGNGSVKSSGAVDARRSKATQEYRFNSEFGLRQTNNKDTLLPSYKRDVNMDQVFGKFDPQGAIHLGESTRDEFERDHMLSMMSSALMY